MRATGLVPFRKIGVETGRYRRQLTNHIMVMRLVALPLGCVQAESQSPDSKEKLGRESVLHRKQLFLRVESFGCVRAWEHCKGVQSFLRVRLRPQQKAEQDSPWVGFS